MGFRVVQRRVPGLSQPANIKYIYPVIERERGEKYREPSDILAESEGTEETTPSLVI